MGLIILPKHTIALWTAASSASLNWVFVPNNTSLLFVLIPPLGKQCGLKLEAALRQWLDRFRYDVCGIDHGKRRVELLLSQWQFGQNLKLFYHVETSFAISAYLTFIQLLVVVTFTFFSFNNICSSPNKSRAILHAHLIVNIIMFRSPTGDSLEWLLLLKMTITLVNNH